MGRHCASDLHKRRFVACRKKPDDLQNGKIWGLTCENSFDHALKGFIPARQSILLERRTELFCTKGKRCVTVDLLLSHTVVRNVIMALYLTMYQSGKIETP